MWEQQVLFKNMKSIKDDWVEGSLKRLKGEDNSNWVLGREAYEVLGKIVNTEEGREAYAKVLNEVIKGVMHSMMAMFDGADALTDEFSIDVINSETGESLLSYSALNDEFFDYIMDAEEEEEK